MQFRFIPETHTYTLDGVPVPSVTQLLKPIGTDFSMIRPDVLENKRQLGTVVHEACEYDDDGDLHEESLPAVVVPYVTAWRRFRSDTGATILANELQLVHEALRFAGTIDRMAEIDGERWLLDIKTSAEPVPSYGVQLAGYQLLMHMDDQPVRRATVHLRADGTYRMHEFKNPNDLAAFRALLAIHNWKEATK